MRATSSWIGQLIKVSSTGVIAIVALIALMLALTAVSGPSSANPFFKVKTGLQCKSCHQPGMEMSGTRALTSTGSAFLRAFSANPDQALRDFSADRQQRGSSAGNQRAENCTAQFNCNGNTSLCHFRLFGRNGAGRLFQVNGGRSQMVNNLYRGVQYCESATGNPNDNCNRQTVKMKYCN